MSRTIIVNVLRFAIILLVQVLVLKRFNPGWEGIHYVQFFLYPLFIMLLPFQTPKVVSLLLAFCLGISVDLFYGTSGLHASPLIAMAFIRPSVIKYLEPRGGYTAAHSPTKARMGMPWFLRYSAFLLAMHLFLYFLIESFTFVKIGEILLKTVLSFIGSMIFVMMAILIFNPKE